MEKKLSFKKAVKKAEKGLVMMRRTGLTGRRYLRISSVKQVQCFLETDSAAEREVPLCVEDVCVKDWTVLVPIQTIDEIKCDRCGKPAEFDEGGGVCDSCGDNLCPDCGQWTSEEDDERCEQCRREAKTAFSRCPRCNRTDIRLIDKYPSRSGDVRNRWKIVCNYCGIEKDGFTSKQEAIDWWNTGEPYKAED